MNYCHRQHCECVEHQTAINNSASHQQTVVLPYFYFVLKCLNSFANQMLARNIAELVNSAQPVALEATHIYLDPGAITRSSNTNIHAYE